MSAVAAAPAAPAATLLDLLLQQRRDLRQYLRRQQAPSTALHAAGAWYTGSSSEDSDSDSDDGMDHSDDFGFGGHGPGPSNGTGRSGHGISSRESEEILHSQPKRSMNRRGAMGFGGDGADAPETAAEPYVSAPAAAASPPGRSPRKRRRWGGAGGEAPPPREALPRCRRGLEDAMDRFAAVVISDASEDIQPEKGLAERSVRRRCLVAADVAEAHSRNDDGNILTVHPPDTDNRSGTVAPCSDLGRLGTETPTPLMGPALGPDDDSIMSMDDL